MSYAPRLFPDDASIRRVGEGLLARTLPKEEWTHEAHLASFLWLMLERPEIDLERDVREIISRYNEATGGVNSDTAGYHDTITHCFLIGIRAHVAKKTKAALATRVNALLMSPEGEREWPLRFYSRELLFSVRARRSFVPPDLAPIEAALSDALWTAAASALGENPYALVHCPECNEGILRTRDQPLTEPPGMVRRFLTCDLCLAEATMRLRAQSA